MGYAGQPMKVIKANRALLQKRNTFKEVKKMFLESAEKTEVEFKKISPQKLEQIKTEIRKKAKEDTWKETGIYLGCLLVVLWFLYWVTYS